MNLAIIGQTVKEIRPMTPKEIDNEGWSTGSTAVVLSNGVVLYASCDEEGNGHGEIFGRTEKGKTFSI